MTTDARYELGVTQGMDCIQCTFLPDHYEFATIIGGDLRAIYD